MRSDPVIGAPHISKVGMISHLFARCGFGIGHSPPSTHHLAHTVPPPSLRNKYQQHASSRYRLRFVPAYRLPRDCLPDAAIACSQNKPTFPYHSPVTYRYPGACCPGPSLYTTSSHHRVLPAEVSCLTGPAIHTPSNCGPRIHPQDVPPIDGRSTPLFVQRL